MALVERLANPNYISFGTETTKGTAVIPGFYVPFYNETLMTNTNFQMQDPAAGIVFDTFDVLKGQRDHQGDITVPDEPNTAAHLYDMTLGRISSSGAGPYTNVFGYSATVLPKSKTVDISKGNIVTRFFGVEGSNVVPVWNNNEKQLKVTVSARGSFQSRTIATVATTTLTLDATYDPTPNLGLVVGDLVRIFKTSTGATLDTTIATVNVDGITVTLGASAAAFATGDIIALRPAAASLNLLPTFLWARTQFVFSDTVANALSATQTRIEKGSTYELKYPFENNGGSPRSGGFDPAALPRLTGTSTLTIKKAFDTPENVQAFNDMTKSAVLVRSYSGATNQYEERIAFYSVTIDKPVAPQKSKEINYATMNFIPNYKVADTADVRVTIIHGLASF